MEKELKIRFFKRILLLWIVGLFFVSNAFAQQQILKGVVKDEKGESLIGAGIVVKGTTNGSFTNENGAYTLSNLKEGITLTISCLGYITQEMNYTGQSELNFTLVEDSKMLDNVVVIGYGQVRKGDVTGSIVSVKVDESTRGFSPNSQDLLTGKIAGVSITSAGGSPTGNSTIRIRGGSSLSATNDPLIVIDGIMIDNGGVGGVGNVLSTINPSDIETFTVLKDASATAIYGSRASNGVILITTKKGSDGKMKITYDGNVSVSTRKKGIDVMDGDEFRAFVTANFAGLTTYDEVVNQLGTENTNWQDEIFQTAISTDHNLSIFGNANNVLPYRASFGYTNLEGILKTSAMERYTGSFSLSPSLFNNNLKISLNGRGMYSKNRFADQSAIGEAINMDPTKPVYDEKSPYGGYYTWVGSTNQIIQVATKNPVSLLEMREDKADAYNFIGNSQFDYKLPFFPDLKFNLNLGIDYSKSDGHKFNSPLAASEFIYGGSVADWDQTRTNTSLDFYSQYTKDLDFLNSKFDIMGGYSWQNYWKEGSEITERVTALDANGNPLLVAATNYETEYYLVSFFGRINYGIMDRYLLTFSMRDDGSSRFSQDNRWALFPSAAFAWRIMEESFMQNVDLLSNLKLRLGWGITGQQDIGQGDYPYLGTYSKSIGDQTSYLRGFNADGTPIWSSLLRPDAYNSNLKWESTTTYNAGLDYGFFNNRIEGSLDLYYRETTDLINTATKVPAGINFKEYVAANIGSLENRGVEFSINTKPIVTTNVTWDFGANIAYNQNELTKLTLSNELNSKIPNGNRVNMVGEAANMWYVYEQVYDEAGKPLEGLYKDRNNDGKINEQDLRPYKNGTPDYTFGLNTKLTYKAWDLSIAGHGSHGNYNYNSMDAGRAPISPNSVYANEFLINRPQSVFNTNFQNNQTSSDYYVQDASFFRIDNINLGWSFKNINALPINGRIYSTVQNPFVFTNYSGLDPEVFGGDDNNVYPRPLIVMLGVNLNF